MPVCLPVCLPAWPLASQPPLFWYGYAEATTQVVAGMALCTHVVSAVKDILCLPRPAQALGPSTSLSLHENSSASKHSSRGGGGSNSSSGGNRKSDGRRTHDPDPDSDPGGSVKVLSVEKDIEYGAPSLHAASALFMPLYMTLLFRDVIGADRATALNVVSVVWAAWVCWGRLYLGVHTPLDLLAGGLLALALLPAWSVLGTWYMVAARTEVGVGAQLLCSLLSLAAYPTPTHHTTSFLNVVTFQGAW